MIGFDRSIFKWGLLYAVLVVASISAGSISEWAGHALLLLSSLFFSTVIVYASWRESKPMKEIEYPIESAASNRNQLYDAVQEALSGKRSTYIVSRLQQILAKKISLRLDLTEEEARKFLQNPKNLRDLGYDKLALLISKDNFSTKEERERIKLLHTILSQLEED
ncbi:MAG: hypothetical protein RMJ15_00565 [Nitrososphaerota archaeon]|nr:hypothetical protein [Candidatus Bathyarchaeota archaeon]MDW8022226.1 hypothetical protein [Nitrososphaerota archaeon]